MTAQSNKGIRVRKSGEFRLKPREGKNFQVLQLSQFGFTPETIIFERVSGNSFVISAVLTEEEIKKEDQKLKKEKKNGRAN